MNGSEKFIVNNFFSKREEGFQYAPFDREIAFYESICAGNMELVKMYYEPLLCEGSGTLSKDPLRNIKYHFAVSVALIARFCVSGGMTTDESYGLSDTYIMRADECDNVEGVRTLHYEMVEVYTHKMRRIISGGIYSKRIVRTIDYISEHLHSRIMIEDAAEVVKINPSYLSRLFRMETGCTFSEYVNRRKIEEAMSLLRFSDYSDIEISSLLSFSSQSYFIKVFRKYARMTPSEYKKRYRFRDF